MHSLDQSKGIGEALEKTREFQKTSTFASLTTQKPCVDHTKLWEILKEMGIPNHLTYYLRDLYAGREAIVRTRHGTTAAAAKSLQSCPTLCDPIDGSPLVWPPDTKCWLIGKDPDAGRD